MVMTLFPAPSSGGGPPLSNANPQPTAAAAAPGTSSDASRDDHVHVGAVPPLSNATPQPTGTAAPGTSTNASRDDHVHASSGTGGLTFFEDQLSADVSLVSGLNSTIISRSLAAGTWLALMSPTFAFGNAGDVSSIFQRLFGSTALADFAAVQQDIAANLPPMAWSAAFTLAVTTTVTWSAHYVFGTTDPHVKVKANAQGVGNISTGVVWIQLA